MTTNSNTILLKSFNLDQRTPIKEWLRDFELISRINKWKDEEQILYLSIFLEGTIKTWFINQKLIHGKLLKNYLKTMQLYQIILILSEENSKNEYREKMNQLNNMLETL